jgi:hypothetical protein
MTVAAFLEGLELAAERAEAAEVGFRREAANRIATLERERAFAFRRLNLMRAVADAVSGAESEDAAVANALATLRARLDWSGDSEAQSAVLSRFSPVAAALFCSMAPERQASAPALSAQLAEFEAWYAETRGRPFWELFEHQMPETPVVDF